MKEFLSKNTDHNPPFEFFYGKRERHQEQRSRATEMEKALLNSPNSEVIYPEEFTPLPIHILKVVHSSDYVDFLTSTKEGKGRKYRYPSVFPPRRSSQTRQPNGLLGYYSCDMYTPVNSKIASAALTAATGAYNAAQAVLRGEKTTYAVGRPPGHHAGYDYMGGYCYINNSAVAAYTLSEQGRVAVVDVDFHHGNGTEDIFKTLQAEQEEPKVITISIHADPNRMFPYFSGHSTTPDTPFWQGINYALGPDITNQEYDRVLNKVLRQVDDLRVDYLVVPIGYDTHEADPIGDFKLTTPYYEQISRRIMELGLPTVFIQEGGYNTELLANNIKSFIRGIED
ncbi:hypothetical protein A3C26_01310 [Candidatus Daviesbacteria bacterium RIFCSPHIGHO2_02_FULL_39_12]|uniref:Histone deacetylase domain-containing protein n=2 Tax=Candidatus Daviesiibacteriota TaxID=1752718 RepID=A0A1F5JBZ6_9BACT|nr:MAG: hypothetical protein A3C26_01310 [Candidatus Daviesbacteria bacterium RIFCSPHIGHO2_02_FULL_39_12]OGE72000.1 MAG: hypothetical protein A3H40_00460 [Candidatus Daviesbacteria bacterium RIFCSPLOWO2_02_FULL_38_15]